MTRCLCGHEEHEHGKHSRACGAACCPCAQYTPEPGAMTIARMLDLSDDAIRMLYGCYVDRTPACGWLMQLFELQRIARDSKDWRSYRIRTGLESIYYEGRRRAQWEKKLVTS